jgi:nitroreductase
VQGAALEALRADYVAAFEAGKPGKPGYQYSPNPLPETWAARAKATGVGIFKHKGIGREDAEKRRAHDRENFRFFGAQQVFFLGTQENAFSHGTFLDCGFVLDNLMLGLTSLGYGSCPQFSVMVYPDLLKKHIPNSTDTLFIAGLPFGRPKAGSNVNAFQPVRESIDSWFKTIG